MLYFYTLCCTSIFYVVGLLLYFMLYFYVSESDNLSPIGYVSNIENLVSLERAMFEDNSFNTELTYS